MPTDSDMRIVLFDGMCNLCNGTVSFIIKRDKKRKFHFAPIQSEAGQSLIERYGLNKDLSTVYYICGEVSYQKSAAILHILKDLGGGWKCYYPLIFVPACIRDGIYRWVSRNRYRWFGRKKSCMRPSQKLQDRFLH